MLKGVIIKQNIMNCAKIDLLSMFINDYPREDFSKKKSDGAADRMSLLLHDPKSFWAAAVEVHRLSQRIRNYGRDAVLLY